MDINLPIQCFSIYHSNSPQQALEHCHHSGMRLACEWLFITKGRYDATCITYFPKSDPQSIATINEFLSRLETYVEPVIFNSINTIKNPFGLDHIIYATSNIPPPLFKCLTQKKDYHDFDKEAAKLGEIKGLETHCFEKMAKPTEARIMSRFNAHQMKIKTVVMRVPVYSESRFSSF